MEEDNICVICNENIIEEDHCKLLCDHVFHSGCIQSWFLINKNSCPLCRRGNNRCQHAADSEAHLKPHLFIIIEQQKELLKKQELKIAELENLIHVYRMQQHELPEAGFSFQNTSWPLLQTLGQTLGNELIGLGSQGIRSIRATTQIRSTSVPIVPERTMHTLTTLNNGRNVRPMLYTRR